MKQWVGYTLKIVVGLICRDTYVSPFLAHPLVVDKIRTVTDYHKTTDQSTNHGPKYKTRTNGSIFTDGSGSDKTWTITGFFRDRTITLHDEHYVVTSRRHRY